MTEASLPGRALARAVDVRPAEIPGLLAAFAYHFLLFTGYYILRPIRDSMGVTGGVENLDEQFGWVLLCMLVIVPLFGWISGRYRRSVFLPWTYVFFAVQLVGFFAEGAAGRLTHHTHRSHLHAVAGDVMGHLDEVALVHATLLLPSR